MTCSIRKKMRLKSCLNHDDDKSENGDVAWLHLKILLGKKRETIKMVGRIKHQAIENLVGMQT
jgi:hypothetical protein